MVQDEWMTLGQEEEALWWLDRQSGHLVRVSPQDWEQAAQGAPEGGELPEGLSLALRIREDPDRYMRVPLSPEQDLADAREFVSTVLSSVVQRRLQGVLDGPRAMDRFRALLTRHPEELARWQAFRAARLRQRIQEWLGEQGVHRR